MLEGLPQREIAEVLGITAINVAVRLNRARSELTRRLALATAAEYATAALIVCVVAWRLATERCLDAFAETTRDYLDLALALERIRRRERSLAFAWMLLGVQVAILMAWYPTIWFLWPERTWDLIESTPSLVAWVVFVLGAMTGWSAYVCSRGAREPRDLEQLRTDLVAGC